MPRLVILAGGDYLIIHVVVFYYIDPSIIVHVRILSDVTGLADFGHYWVGGGRAGLIV